MRRPLPPLFLVTFVLVLVSNLGAVLALLALIPLRFVEGDRQVIREGFTDPVGAIFQILAFLVPMALLAVWIRPVDRALRPSARGLPPGDLAEKRLLSLPLTVGLYSLLGWFIGTTGAFFTARGHQLIGPLIFPVLMGSVLTAAFSITLSVALLEWILRRWYVPVFFPPDRLASLPNAMSPRLQTRFFLHFTATVLFPASVIALFFIGLVGAGHEVQAARTGLWFLGAVTVLAFLVTRLFAASLIRPLGEMQKAANRVREGDFSERVPVLGIDEVGRLGESLNRMTASLAEKEKIHDSFGKAVDPQVRDYLLSGDLRLGGELRDASILFCDIRGFTGISERLGPEATVLWLNRFFEKAHVEITREGGLVNKFVGDSILAVYGLPLPVADHAARAVRSACALVRAAQAMSREFLREGKPEIRLGVGIHSGPVLAGNIGSPLRMEYTVVGDAVNVASRIEEINKEYGTQILYSEAVSKRVPPALEGKPVASVSIRGRVENVRLYTIDP